MSIDDGGCIPYSASEPSDDDRDGKSSTNDASPSQHQKMLRDVDKFEDVSILKISRVFSGIFLGFLGFLRDYSTQATTVGVLENSNRHGSLLVLGASPSAILSAIFSRFSRGWPMQQGEGEGWPD
jgi:hypothetical protein